MAPRGGGGHGGGGHSGGSGGSTGGSSYNSTMPIDSIVLPGHHFKDPFLTAALAISALGLLACIIVFVWRGAIKKPRLGANRTIVGGWAFGVTLTLGTLFFALDLANRVCIELQLSVPRIYNAIWIPMEFFREFFDIALLACVLFGPVHVGLDELNYGVWDKLKMPGILLLVVLCFAERGLSTYVLISQQFGFSQGGYGRYGQVNAAFYGVYFVVALSAIAACIVIFVKAPRSKTHGQRRRGTVPFWLIVLIVPALFVRSVASLAFSVYFKVLAHALVQHMELPIIALYTVPTILLIAGLLKIGLTPEVDETRYFEPEKAASFTPTEGGNWRGSHVSHAGHGSQGFGYHGGPVPGKNQPAVGVYPVPPNSPPIQQYSQPVPQQPQWGAAQAYYGTQNTQYHHA